MAFTLRDLPFDKNSLAPHISAETIDFHYGKHHQAYVTNLNNLIADSSHANKNLEEIILTADGGVFNNAAQVWNHDFYWDSITPGGGGDPTGALADQLTKDFGSVARFREEFAQAAATQFGSGWAWLVWDGNKLAIQKTGNADNPIKSNNKPLLTIDVWEHAYYVDYRNARPKYIDIFLQNLVNWDFAAKNLAKFTG